MYTLVYWVTEGSPPRYRYSLPYALAYALAESGWYKAQVVCEFGIICHEIKLDT